MARRVSLEKAVTDLANSQVFWNFMEPVILNLRNGMLGKLVGYRTRVSKDVKVRVRTPRYSKSVLVDWSLGEGFGEAHYRDIMDKVYLNPQAGFMDYELRSHLDSVYGNRDLSWKGVCRQDWWRLAAMAVVHREVGNNARWFCEQVFAAAKEARDDPKAVGRLQKTERSQRVTILRNAIRGALDAGVTKKEISRVIDVAIVESVMDG